MLDVPLEDVLFTAFSWVFLAAWRALPLLCIVLLADLLLRRRIAARFHCLLWMIVAARLLCPFSVESSLSLHRNLMNALESAGFSNHSRPANPYDSGSLAIDSDTYTYRNEAGQDVVYPALPVDEAALPVYVAASPSFSDSAPAEQPAPMDVGRIISFTFVGLWLLGTCFLLLRGLVQSLRFATRLRRSETVDEQSVVDEVLRACDAIGVGRQPVLKEVEGLTVPAVSGIRRPAICLPMGSIEELSRSELRLVLRHELAHVKRRDGFVLTLCLLIRALHWLNPMAWLIVARIRHYMEQSADEIALQTYQGINSTDYGHLLLKFATGSPQPQNLAAIGLLFSSTGRRLARRIDMLDGSERRNHWLAKIAAIAAVITLAVTGLTDAKPVETILKPAPMNLIPDVAESWQQFRSTTPPAPPEPRDVIERTYEVTDVLSKLRETRPDRNPEEFLLEIVAPEISTLSDARLTATVPADRHNVIEQRLQQLARFGHWEIQFEVRFIEVALDHLSSMGVDWLSDAVQPEAEHRGQPLLPPDPEVAFARFETPESGDLVIQMRQTDAPAQPVLGVRVTDQQARRFFRGVASDTRSSVMLAPKVRLFNGMAACISDEVIRPFVTGLRPGIGEQDRSMEPVIDCIPEGFRFHLRGDVTDEEEIQVRCAVTMSRLEEVALANLPIRADDESGSRLTIQVPETRSLTVHAGGTLQRTESLLIACPTTFTKDQPRQESHALCYIVTPRWSRDFDTTLPAARPDN